MKNCWGKRGYLLTWRRCYIFMTLILCMKVLLKGTFFHLVKNEEGCMPFLLVRKHNFPNQVTMVYFHPYRNSKCPNLDSALPYYRPSHYLYSILHQCACTAQSTQANSQILKCTHCSSNPPCFSHSPELSPLPWWLLRQESLPWPPRRP